jgi:hypothetical protein
LHVDLDEGAGQLLRLPRRGRLARAQADDDVLHPNRLARLQRQILDDAVALVEQAQHRHALGHWRYARLLGGGARHGDCDGIAFGRLIVAAVAAGEHRQCRQDKGCGSHYWSGVQAL